MPTAGESNYLHPVPAGNNRNDNGVAFLPGLHDDIEAKESYSDVTSLPGSKSSVIKSGSHSSSGDGLECSRDGQLTELDSLRFKSAFLQVIEELRMRRSIDVENEGHIKELVSEKHGLQQKLEEERTHYGLLIEGHSQLERDLRLSFEEKIKHAENEKTKTHLTAEGWDRELKALKDEIRALHLVKYNLEKKVTEQERQLHLQTSSRDSYLSQMNQLDQRCSAALKQAESISEQMDKLEANVRCSKDLHVKLQYVNDHQKCELEVLKSKLEECRVELMEARVKQTERHMDESSEENWGLSNKLKTNDQELKMQLELNKQLQGQLSSLRKEHQDVVRQLKDTHSLIEKHVNALGSVTASEETLLKEVVSLKETVEKLTQELSSSLNVKQALEEKLLKVDNEWSTKYKDIELRLKSLQSDYTTLQETHDKDVELKASELKGADAKISEMQDKQIKLQEELDLAKEEAEQLRRNLKDCTQQSLNLQPIVEKENSPSDVSKSVAVSVEHSTVPASPNLVCTPSPRDSPSHNVSTVPVEQQETDSNSNLSYSPEVLSDSQDLSSSIEQNDANKLSSQTTKDPAKCSSVMVLPLQPTICLEKLPLTSKECMSTSNNVQSSNENDSECIPKTLSITAPSSPSPMKRCMVETDTDSQPPCKKQKSNEISAINVGTTDLDTTTKDSSVTVTHSPAHTSLHSVLLTDRSRPHTNEQHVLPSTVGTVGSSNKIPLSLPKVFATSSQSSNALQSSQQLCTQAKPASSPVTTCSNHDIEETSEVQDLENSENLSIVFSDEDGTQSGDDRLLDTQMNKQIDKVQMFLKLDRLRRPKRQN